MQGEYHAYQKGWIDALDRILEIGHISKEDLLAYCEGKRDEIIDDLK
ncbi:MAG: hypothetical protein ACR2M7_06010 [Bdellovibrionales bacterium]